MADFIKTIEEDDDIVIEEDEDEEEEVVKKPQAKGKKGKSNVDSLDTGFTFELFGNEVEQQQHSWDFTKAKSALREFDNSKSVDEKIRRRIEAKKKAVEEEEDSEEDEQNFDEDETEVGSGEEDNFDENEADEDGEDDDGKEDEENEEDGEEDQNNEEEDQEEQEQEEEVEEVEEEPAPKRKRKSKREKEDDPELNPIIQQKKKNFFSKIDEKAGKASDEVKVDWEDLKLGRALLKAIQVIGYDKPTPIQAKAIPVALQAKDIVGSAVTGSGKTAAFLLPILNRLLLTRDRRIPTIRALILLPTRELAVQCHAMAEKLAQYTDITVCLVTGGFAVNLQEAALRKNPDIVVATPGRIIDHLRNSQSVALEDVDMLVLDEADRLLAMGFNDEVEEILKLCPKTRHTQLFSATIAEEVDRLIKLSLKDPVRVSVSPKLTVAERLTQEFIKIKSNKEANREALLLALCSRTVKNRAVVFFAHKKDAHRTKILFGLAGLNAAELHGNLTQNQRLEALEKFRDGKADFLLATDLAARGLDILGIETVINYVMPLDVVEYIHRVGRTARAGESGRSISFAGESDRKVVKQVLKRAHSKILQRVIPVDEVEYWKNRVSELNPDVWQILREEKEEYIMRKADMEMQKAQNLLDYDEEIYSRPKKTWHASEKEKRQVQLRAKQSLFGEQAATENGEDDKNGKNKRKREDKPERPRREPAPRSRVERRRHLQLQGVDLEAAKRIQRTSKKKLKEQAQEAKKRENAGAPKRRMTSSFEDEIKSSNFKAARDLPTKTAQESKRNVPKKGGKFKSKQRYKRRK